MDTTHDHLSGSHVERLEALAALDPGDAPDAAEALASMLAVQLEGPPAAPRPEGASVDEDAGERP